MNPDQDVGGGDIVMQWNLSKQVRTPVALLHSLSDKYPWEKYETPDDVFI